MPKRWEKVGFKVEEIGIDIASPTLTLKPAKTKVLTRHGRTKRIYERTVWNQKPEVLHCMRPVHIFETLEQAQPRRKKELEAERKLKARSASNLQHLANIRAKQAARRIAKKLLAAPKDQLLSILIANTVVLTRKEKRQ